jgi:predicted enzyme related to lactoylglutathione lyase
MAARKTRRAARAKARKTAPAKRRPAKKTAKRGAAKKKAAPRAKKKSAPRAKKKSVARAKKAAPRKAAKRAAPKPRAAKPAPSAMPSAIGLLTQHMDYTTHTLDEVKRFYTELLGFSRFDHDPNMNYLMVMTGPSSSLGFMPPMPGPPEQWRPPREPTLYLIVVDVDRAYRDLTAKGVTFDDPPADMPWGHRVAVARDPEGRTVCFAQVTGGG